VIGLSLKASPRAVIIQDGFWSQRRKTNQVASIPSIHEELLEHGRMNNFLRLQGKPADRQKGPVYSDSDIYKWAEAVGFQLQVAHNPELRKMTDAIIRDTCLYLLLTDGSGHDCFGSPYLAVCASKRIGESILVALVAAIETGEVFFDNHFK
jgi:hypothetical protein